MHEVQVSAARRLSDTGIQQTTLDTAVLHRNVAMSMSDILTQHSSLFIKSYGRATESTAEFRGTSPAHTQVLWNGMHINSPMLGTVDFSTIPAYFVDEATLLHGASSLAATGGGLGGAVVLSTSPVRQHGLSAQYIQGVGSYTTFDQFLRLTYGNSRWSNSTRVGYATSAGDFHYTNYDKKVDVRDADGNITSSYHPTEHNRSGYFHDLHALHESYYDTPHAGRIGLAAWFTHSLRGLPFLSVDYRDDADFTNEHQQDAIRAVAMWQHSPAATWSLDVRGGYAWQDIAYDYYTHRSGDARNIITQSQSYSQQAFVQAKADFMPAADWLLSARLGATYNHVRSYDRTPFHIGDNYNRGRMEGALSLSAKYRVTRRLALSAILREELYATDLVPLIPALFADYSIVSSTKTQLIAKASVARNYRYPTMDDLYFQPGGNPDLRPERGFTYDGGLELRHHDKAFDIEANVSAFDSHISDWILWTPNVHGFWQPANIKRVHNYGIEATASPSLTLPRGWKADVTVNYAYTPSINRSDDLEDADTSRGKQLVYVPLHSANATAALSWKSWTLRYLWHSYSERFTTTSNDVSRITGRLKPYYMSDVMLEKDFQLRRTHIALKGVVYNLLDSEYVTVLSRPMPGRHFEVFAEIRL